MCAVFSRRFVNDTFASRTSRVCQLIATDIVTNRRVVDFDVSHVAHIDLAAFFSLSGGDSVGDGRRSAGDVSFASGATRGAMSTLVALYAAMGVVAAPFTRRTAANAAANADVLDGGDNVRAGDNGGEKVSSAPAALARRRA